MWSINMESIINKWERTGLLSQILDEKRKYYVALELEYAARKAMENKDIQIFEKTLKYLKDKKYFKG